MANLSELLYRIKASQGSDADINIGLAVAYGLAPEGYELEGVAFQKYIETLDRVLIWTPPDLTGSFDAVQLVIEAEFPGCGVNMRGPLVERGDITLSHKRTLCEAVICRKFGIRTPLGQGYARTLPLAMCAALIEATLDHGCISIAKDTGGQR